MKKSLLFSIGTLFSLLITSCSGSSGCNCPGDEGGHADEVKLEEDPNSNYVLDVNSSNANGSMSYEIFVRSFYDGDNDSNHIGDLKGVKAKLPYLSSLGIKTIWLMPIHDSPSYHGYDVKDYYSIHPEYGTLADFDALVSEARNLNIDIMIDMVLNHSSKQNPWFNQSYWDYKNNNTSSTSKADWYNWSSTEEGSGYAQYNDLWYECRFDSSMPDFNFDSESLWDEFDNIFKFWVRDHGVKGFRLDAVRYYYYQNTEKNVEVLTGLERLGKQYNSNFYMVGEDWAANSEVLAYHASECDSFFRFGSSLEGNKNDAFMNVVRSSSTRPNAEISNKWAKSIQSYEANVKTANPNGYSSYFLSNHDNDRVGDKVTDCFMKSLVSLYALMPGTPFMYYGEEIGLKGTRITNPDDRSDARRRLPMVWNKNDSTGKCAFPERNRTDLANNEQVEDGVEDQLSTGYSLTNHYKKVINVRNKYPFLKHSVFTNMISSLERDDNQYLVAYKLSLGNDYIIVVHNMNQYSVEMTSPGTEILDEINTNKQKPRLKDGKLAIGAHSTVILK